MYSFNFMLSGAHQYLFSKYFAAVFIGVSRNPNFLDGTFCKNSYRKKTLVPLKLYEVLITSGGGGVKVN